MYKVGVTAILLGLAFDAVALINHPELTLTPLTDPHLSMPRGEVGTVQYQLANHGKQTYYLMMKPMTGVVQQFDKKEYCQEAIELEAGQSCILSLLVSANETIDIKKQGPMLCEDTHDWFEGKKAKAGICIQPVEDEQMSVRELPFGEYSFSIAVPRPFTRKKEEGLGGELKHCFASAGCHVPLFVANNSLPASEVVTGRLQITNTSGVLLTSIKTSGLPAGVSVDSSDCNSKLPLSGNKSCNLVLVPGSTHSAAKPVDITVTFATGQTAVQRVSVQVYTIGDVYTDGNQLFQLPINSNLNFYTAAHTDVANIDMPYTPASLACAGIYQVPEINILLNLYYASNCHNGPIGGFTCISPTSYYWSSTPGTFNNATIDFSTGGQPLSSLDTNRARCVVNYKLVP